MLTLHATAFVCQGDEPGMTNYPIKNSEDVNDISVANPWRLQVESRQVIAQAFLQNLR
ncbi:hypothetical protein [Affinibrenneria salicis]|uniref:hypothetical protein n=1 Tax=Affinibrenneria salicis TaxID=2590031 RepID=UPI00168B044D|nr:hypothetical protein [Affinibrenneria salicis]